MTPGCHQQDRRLELSARRGTERIGSDPFIYLPIGSIGEVLYIVSLSGSDIGEGKAVQILAAVCRENIYRIPHPTRQYGVAQLIEDLSNGKCIGHGGGIACVLETVAYVGEVLFLLCVERLVDGRILRVIIQVAPDAQCQSVMDAQFIGEIDLCIQVVPVSIFEFDGYPLIFRDHLLRSEGHFCRVVVDHIVLILSALEHLSIYENPFGAGEYDEEQLIVRPFEAIRPLVAFESVENIPGEFPLCHGTGCEHFVDDLFGEFCLGFEDGPLQAFIKIQEIPLLLPQVDVPDAEPPLVL